VAREPALDPSALEEVRVLVSDGQYPEYEYRVLRAVNGDATTIDLVRRLRY
jgi:hypothetical protein